MISCIQALAPMVINMESADSLAVTSVINGDDVSCSNEGPILTTPSHSVGIFLDLIKFYINSIFCE
jgi:hypothetical protein